MLSATPTKPVRPEPRPIETDKAGPHRCEQALTSPFPCFVPYSAVFNPNLLSQTFTESLSAPILALPTADLSILISETAFDPAQPFDSTNTLSRQDGVESRNIHVACSDPQSPPPYDSVRRPRTGPDSPRSNSRLSPEALHPFMVSHPGPVAQGPLMATGFGPATSDSRRGVSSPRPKGRGMEVLYCPGFFSLV